MDLSRVVIAEVMRPRGIRGELLVRPCTDVPERFKNLGRVQATLADGSGLEVEVESAWAFKGDWVLKLAGVNSIEQAERFKGADLWVALEERGALDEGEYFQSDLMGCTVIEIGSGRTLGTVDGWLQYGGPPLMKVEVDGREVLIPFVPAICPKVDLTSRTISVELPEGLLEL